MKVKRGMLIIGLLAMLSLAAAETTVNKPENTKVCVGIFDSRAVAIAYAHSEFNSEKFEAKKVEMEKAEAANDTKKIEELEAWAHTQQAKLHRQGFGTAPVHDLLKHIKDDIPKIAKEAGVDIIISKWDVIYQNPSVKLVDITDKIVRPFSPSEKTLKSIRGIQNHAPVSEEVLENMKCENPARDK